MKKLVLALLAAAAVGVILTFALAFAGDTNLAQRTGSATIALGVLASILYGMGRR
jgi:hypothetical protein